MRGKSNWEAATRGSQRHRDLLGYTTTHRPSRTMFRLSRPINLSRRFRSTRSFAVVSVHTHFPATLFRLQVQRTSSLTEFNKQEGTLFDRGLLLSEDGLVTPRISKNVPCMCAVLLSVDALTKTKSRMGQGSCPILSSCKNWFARASTNTSTTSTIANPILIPSLSPFRRASRQIVRYEETDSNT